MNTVNVTRNIEHMQCLVDMGLGLLSQLYFVKAQLVVPNERYSLVSDPALSKLKVKVEKKYPVVPDFAKVAGSDVFHSKSDKILRDFEPFHLTMADVADFCNSTKELLTDFTVKIIDFKLRKNRNLILLYFDLLTTYMRVLFMVESIEPRVAMSGFYVAASVGKASSATVMAAAQRIKEVFNCCQDLQRSFIDTFAASQIFIMPMLMQLRDSLLLVSNSDELRKSGALNPINMGDNIGAYAKKNLGLNHGAVSAYPEISCAVEQYVDYVVFSLLACPGLLFAEPSSLELLSIATKHRFMVQIFRDLSLNIHIQFEKLSVSFPTPTDQVTVPKGFKLKSALKSISRASISTCGLNARARRRVVAAELSTLTHLIRTTPGLIAPRFPAFLAAANVARCEIEAYFRHATALGLQSSSPSSTGALPVVTCTLSSLVLRKDTRAHFSPEHFLDTDIGHLMATLSEAAAIFQKYDYMVKMYYKEFITGPDLKALRPLFDECGAVMENFRPFFDSFLSDLEQLREGNSIPTAAIVAAGAGDVSDEEEYSKAAGGIEITTTLLNDAQLDGFRLNWDRVVSLASSQQMNSFIKKSACSSAFETLAERMMSVCARTLCVDRCQWLYRTNFDLHNTSWFREALANSFSMTYKDPLGMAAHSFAFFEPFKHVQWTLHADCPEEKAPVFSQTTLLCQTMLSELNTFIMTLLKHLWEHFAALDMQYSPVEAIKRVERAIQTKRSNTTVDAVDHQEGLPGCESEHWAAASIEKLVLLRAHVGALLHGAARVAALQVGPRSYNVIAYMHTHMVDLFREKLHSIFSAPKGDAMGRPAAAVIKLSAGCRALQYALSFVGEVSAGAHSAFAYSSVVRDILYQECGNAMQAIPPPGAPTPLGAPLTAIRPSHNRLMMPNGGASQSLISKLANWITGLVRMVAVPGSGIVWAPTLGGFINAHNRNLIKSSRRSSHHPSKGGGSTAIELYLDLEELKSLAGVIGTQGIRSIESQLLAIIEKQLKQLCGLVYDHRVQLSEFAQCHCTETIADLETSIAGLKLLEPAMEALVQIGVALHVRDLLLKALQHTMRRRAEDVWGSVATAVGAVEPWAALGPLQSLHCLAAAAGVAVDLDLALCAALTCIDLSTAQQQALYTHFPALCAAVNLSEKWSHSTFLPDVEAFDGNEHCMQMAISKVSFFLFVQNQLEGWSNRASQAVALTSTEGSSSTTGRRVTDSSNTSIHSDNAASSAGAKSALRGSEAATSTTERKGSAEDDYAQDGSESSDSEQGDSGDEAEDPSRRNPTGEVGSAYSAHVKVDATKALQSPSFKPQTITGLQMQARFHRYVSSYVQMAAHTILLLSQKCTQNYSDSAEHVVLDYIPFSAMAAQLVYFVRITPNLKLDVLEKFFPHAAIHAGHVSAALGRQCAGDVLDSFPSFGDHLNSSEVEGQL